MKVIAINGSPRKEGNTHHALLMVCEQLHASGTETEILHIGHKNIHGCLACGKCRENKNERCVIERDDVNQWIGQLKEADGILFGAPVYFSGIPGTMKSFMDRLFYVSGSNDGLLRHKVGASVVALRRSGGSATFDSLNHYLLYSEMLIASSNYWNIIHGGAPGEVAGDDEGRQIMRMLGRNMSWLLHMKQASQGIAQPPVAEPKVKTSFIR